MELYKVSLEGKIALITGGNRGIGERKRLKKQVENVSMCRDVLQESLFLL
jgi:hypothetical protein